MSSPPALDLAFRSTDLAPVAVLGTATVLAFATGMTFIPGRDRVEPKPCGKTETTAASSATVDAGASATTPPFPPGQSRPNQTPED